MVSKSYVKALGLDLSQVTREDLKELAFLIEDELSESLNSICGRIDEYEVLVSLSLDSGQINVIVELEYVGTRVVDLELEALLDKIIDDALELFENELLKRYGKTNGTDT